MLTARSSIAIAIMAVQLFVFSVTVYAQADTVEHHVSGRKNSPSQQEKPYVILISADGFRYDYATKYNARHLLQLSANGVSAASMKPSYPSVTFPNHYTIATGLYPSHHGLVANTFFDRKKNEKYSMSNKVMVRDSSWYGGTPLWVLAEQQQMLSANMFWVGSEAAVKGVRPTYHYQYSEDIPISRRIQKVKDWLSLPAAERPHLICFYLSDVDHAGHTYGPDAPETAAAVKLVDSVVYELTQTVKSTGLPVNFIFVADHGMTAVDREHPLPIPVVDSNKFIVTTAGSMVGLYAKNTADIIPLYTQLKKAEKDYTAYLKKDIPAHLHYSNADDTQNRIADVLLIPAWPKVFSNKVPGAGYHGFDPEQVKDMHAVFIAWGPNFNSRLTIPTFENVNIYPLVADILKLNITGKIDGKKEVLHKTLK